MKARKSQIKNEEIRKLLFLPLLVLLITTLNSTSFAKSTSLSQEDWYRKQVENSQGKSNVAPGSEIKDWSESTQGAQGNSVIHTTPALEYNPNQGVRPRFTMGLIGGAFNYPEVSNIESMSGVGGVKLGVYLWKDLILGGDFLYSFQESEINRVTRTDKEDIDHYMISANLGYDFFKLFSFMPNWSSGQVGYVVTHSRRQYNADENASQGFDQGVLASLGARLSQSVLVSLEYRYMQNIDYEMDVAPTSQDRELQRAVNNGQTQELESFDYQMFMLKTELLF